MSSETKKNHPSNSEVGLCFFSSNIAQCFFKLYLVIFLGKIPWEVCKWCYC